MGSPTPWKQISPCQLRQEGVIEIGAVPNTSIVFVLTEEGLHLFHTVSIPDRIFDAYAVAMIITRFEAGSSLTKIANDLGVDPDHVFATLRKVGYVLKSRLDGLERAGAIARCAARRRERQRAGEAVAP